MPAPTHRSNEAPLRSAPWSAITYSCSILKADRRKGVKTSLTHTRISFRTLKWVAETTYRSRTPQEESNRLLRYEKVKRKCIREIYRSESSGRQACRIPCSVCAIFYSVRENRTTVIILLRKTLPAVIWQTISASSIPR